MSPIGHGPRMLNDVYKGALYLLSDAVVRFSMAAGVHNIAAKSRHSPALAYTAVHRASKVD